MATQQESQTFESPGGFPADNLGPSSNSSSNIGIGQNPLGGDSPATLQEVEGIDVNYPAEINGLPADPHAESTANATITPAPAEQGASAFHGSKAPTDAGDKESRSSSSVTSYYQQFTNMNASDRAQEVIRNSYQPFHRPPANDDPEVAQAMLHLGTHNTNDNSGGHANETTDKTGNIENVNPFHTASSHPSSEFSKGDVFSDSGQSFPQQERTDVKQEKPSDITAVAHDNHSPNDFHDDHHYPQLQSMSNAFDSSHDLQGDKDSNDGMDESNLAQSHSHPFHGQAMQPQLPYSLQPTHHPYAPYGLANGSHQNSVSHGHAYSFPVPFQGYHHLDRHHENLTHVHKQNGPPFYNLHHTGKSEAITTQNVGNVHTLHHAVQMQPQGHFPDHLQHPSSMGQYMETPGGGHVMDPRSHGSDHLHAQHSQVYQVVHSKNDSMHKKRKRPVDMPRRPLSAYNFFFSEERVRLLAEIPDPDENKTASSKDIDTEVSSTDDNHDINKESSASSERLLKIRDAKILKRRPHRKSHGKIAFKDLAREVGKRWKALDELEKARYNDLAEKDLQRYNEQMKDYNSKRNRFAGASYQTSPGPLPPQLHMGEEKTNVVPCTQNIHSTQQIIHQQGQSNNPNHGDAPHPNIYSSIPMHYPRATVPHAFDNHDANFFLNTNNSMDVPSVDCHLVHYTFDQYNPMHNHQKQSHISANTDVPESSRGTNSRE